MTTSRATWSTPRRCSGLLLLIASGGAARQAFMPRRTKSSLRWPPAAAASNCSSGWSPSRKFSVNEVQKRFNRVSDYGRAIERIHSHGIAVQAGIVFGFDNDRPAIFGETVDFLEEVHRFAEDRWPVVIETEDDARLHRYAMRMDPLNRATVVGHAVEALLHFIHAEFARWTPA